MWSAPGAAIVIAFVFVASARWHCWRISSRGIALSIAQGQIILADGRGVGVAPGWTFARTGSDQINSWFDCCVTASPVTRSIPFIAVPLWAVALPLLPAGVLAWRLDILAHTRELPYGCPRCGDNQVGLPAGAACPECGTMPDQTWRN